MTLAQWIAKYEQKTGEKFEAKTGFKLLYSQDRGFCEIRVDEEKKMVMIWQLCGDGRFWRDFAELLAGLFGYRNLGTITIRHEVEAYVRLFGFKIERKELLPDGYYRYYGVGTGSRSKCLCSPAWISENGRMAYYVTWEVEQ